MDFSVSFLKQQNHYCDKIKFKNVNRFRKARGHRLRAQINQLADLMGRDVAILDVGGRREYWDNLSLERISSIEILNYDESEFEKPDPTGFFRQTKGDARDLSNYPDQSVDFVHSNSVIEHVGSWQNMEAMAKELCRVGQAG